jgi:hypothetical protein
MTATLRNTKRVLIEESPSVSAVGVERLAINGTNKDILVLSPIANVGWNTTYNCMDIKRVDDIADLVLGISLTPIGYNAIRLVKYITSGIISGIDTGAWAIGDVIRATSTGLLTNESSSLIYDILPQQLARVERVHATDGEIQVFILGTAAEPGVRRKSGIVVTGGADTPITFTRPMFSAPHVEVSVRDEAGVAIGADVVPGSETITGFTVSVSSGGTGVHTMFYRAEVDA